MDIQIARHEVETHYSKNGQFVASVYSNDGHWYACDDNGDDLPEGWRLDTRAEAELVAERWARNA